MKKSGRKLYNMVTDCFGAAVYPVEPYLLYSTDKTTEYIFEGTKKKFVPYVLTTKSSISKRGTNAVYKCEDNKSMSGMHDKLTFTFSAMGHGYMFSACVHCDWFDRTKRDDNQKGVYSC